MALSPRAVKLGTVGDKTGGQMRLKFACALSPIFGFNDPHEAVPNPYVLAAKQAVPDALPSSFERIIAALLDETTAFAVALPDIKRDHRAGSRKVDDVRRFGA